MPTRVDLRARLGIERMNYRWRAGMLKIDIFERERGMVERYP